MKANIKNYHKPTPVRLKAIGDLGLLLIPTIQGFLASAPEGTFTPTQLWLIGAVSSTVLVIVKFGTKMFAEEETNFPLQGEAGK